MCIYRWSRIDKTIGIYGVRGTSDFGAWADVSGAVWRRSTVGCCESSCCSSSSSVECTSRCTSIFPLALTSILLFSSCIHSLSIVVVARSYQFKQSFIFYQKLCFKAFIFGETKSKQELKRFNKLDTSDRSTVLKICKLRCVFKIFVSLPLQFSFVIHHCWENNTQSSMACTCLLRVVLSHVYL